MFRENRATGEALAPTSTPETPAAGTGATLVQLMQSPLYQVRRVLRVTQTHWALPMARGKRAARLARREAPLLTAPRPGAFAQLAG